DFLSESSGSKRRKRREIGFGEFGLGDRMLFMAWDGNWKYIYSPNGKREALFCLRDDPDELNNLASQSRYSTEKNRLRKALVEFLRAGGHKDALSADGSDLAGYEEREIPAWRNRQYAKWTHVNTPCNWHDIYQPE